MTTDSQSNNNLLLTAILQDSWTYALDMVGSVLGHSFASARRSRLQDVTDVVRYMRDCGAVNYMQEGRARVSFCLSHASRLRSGNLGKMRWRNIAVRRSEERRVGKECPV